MITHIGLLKEAEGHALNSYLVSPTERVDWLLSSHEQAQIRMHILTILDNNRFPHTVRTLEAEVPTHHFGETPLIVEGNVSALEKAGFVEEKYGYLWLTPEGQLTVQQHEYDVFSGVTFGGLEG